MSASDASRPYRSGSREFHAAFACLQPHMQALDGFLRSQLDSFEPEIRGLVSYTFDTSGKRIRPALVFLAGWSEDGKISPDLVRAAAVVEMVHLATLVHDDIMDGAELRRNRRTVAREYGAHAAVLLGDSLFAHALNAATQFPSTEVCFEVSDSTRHVCAGEIIQTLRRGSASITLADYRRIIDLKTAELFRVSCHLGARLAGYAREYVAAVAVFGRHLGIAYQIYDDLADFFGEEQRIGKTLGTDFASGKLTLPLLLLLEKMPAAERADLLAEIANQRPQHLELHLRQMNEHGIFGEVADAVFSELEKAAATLRPWPQLAPTPLLLQLCEVLRGQVGNLRAPAAV